MIRAIHHTEVTVPKGMEPQARAFYCGVLGFAEIPKPEALRARGGLWLDAGSIQLHIGVEDGVLREKTKAHVAYEVADVGLLRERLSALGLPVLDSVPIPGYDRFEARDPFGNRMEFLQRRRAGSED